MCNELKRVEREIKQIDLKVKKWNEIPVKGEGFEAIRQEAVDELMDRRDLLVNAKRIMERGV